MSGKSNGLIESINEQIRQFDENVRSTRTKLMKLSVIQGLSSDFLCNFSNLLIYRNKDKPDFQGTLYNEPRISDKKMVASKLDCG